MSLSFRSSRGSGSGSGSGYGSGSQHYRNTRDGGRQPRRSASPLPGSRRPSPPMDAALREIRVLIQDRHEPDEVDMAGPDHEYFRLAVFALNFALTLLNSAEGRRALEATCEAIFQAAGRRGRREMFFQGTSARTAVVDFLDSIAANPPNIFVSTRVTGEGATFRVSFEHELPYNAKRASTMRLSKRLFDAASQAARQGTPEGKDDFHMYLFMLGLGLAHELVHVFVGYLYGDADYDTPPQVQYPVRPNPHSGQESGNYWEADVMHALIQAFQLRDGSPGLFAVAGSRTSLLSSNWIAECLHLDFSFPPRHAVDDRNRTIPLPRQSLSMQEVWGPALGRDFPPGFTYTNFFNRLEALPTHAVSHAQLRDIMSMVDQPARLFRPSAITY